MSQRRFCGTYALFMAWVAVFNSHSAVALQYLTDVLCFCNPVAHYKLILQWERIYMMLDVCASSWPAAP